MALQSLPQVKLEPPGAGLPVYELAWLRPGFHFICAVLPQGAALGLFKSEGERVLSLAQTVSAEQGAVPMLIDRVIGIEDSSRGWSVFMVLDHLRIVNEGIASIIEALTQDRPFAEEVRIQDVKPSPTSGPETIERFVASVENYEAAVTRLGKFGRNMRHPHPWFGPMTAHDWHCLAAIHSWVHRRQLERIKSGLEQVRA
jgi:DinB superfamily